MIQRVSHEPLDGKSPLPDPRGMSSLVPQDIPFRDVLLSALERGDEDTIGNALNASVPQSARAAWNALADLLENGNLAATDGAGVRYFAFPMIIVAGSRSELTVPGALPDISAIVSLLERHGAVGVTRNFGVGNALCAVESLETLSPVLLWRALRDTADQGLLSGLQPAPLRVSAGREQVHLRFLVGAGVTPAHLPALRESASNVGAWGAPVTRELARQLAQPGLEILPMLRPPQSLSRAAYLGRREQLEAALSLFLSNTLKRFRTSVGDPQAVLSAHQMPENTGEIRVSLSSPLDDSMLEGFRWPLHPLDDVGEVADLLASMLKDYGVRQVMHVGNVLPDLLQQGMRFVAAGMAAGVAQAQ